MTDRIAMVDDMICDCIQSLSLKRHKGKERQIIERYAQRIVERVDQDGRATIERAVQRLIERDCPYLGGYKLGYDSALDDLLHELWGDDA